MNKDKHMTPDGLVQNFLEEFEKDNPDYEYDAKVRLMWAQTDYYKAMTELVKEQTINEKLKQAKLKNELGVTDE